MRKISRRKFLGITAAALVTTPNILSMSAFGRDGVSPNNRITLGCIGVGGQGTYDMKALMNQPGVQVVALCDADSEKLKAFKRLNKLTV